MVVEKIWRNCEFINYDWVSNRERKDCFWVKCSVNEFNEKILSYVIIISLNDSFYNRTFNDNFNSYYWIDHGKWRYFLISRDLSSISCLPWSYPYSAFNRNKRKIVNLKYKEIHDLKELKKISRKH